MKLAVLSGKGGTGKTFISVNLASVDSNSVYIDCDVEEPDGNIFFKPENVQLEKVYKMLPSFDADKCTACRACVEFCQFNALAFIGKKPMVFPEVCHDCGGCTLVCKSGAITATKKEIGTVTEGSHSDITVISGTLQIGEASGIPVIKTAIRKGEKLSGSESDLIVDCPPGSACSVMESIKHVDFCILVAEPTVFGLHNLKMVYKLVKIMGKRCGLIVNKADENNFFADFCKQNNIPLLASIPYSKKTAESNAAGVIAVENDKKLKTQFETILTGIREVVV